MWETEKKSIYHSLFYVSFGAFYINICVLVPFNFVEIFFFGLRKYQFILSKMPDDTKTNKDMWTFMMPKFGESMWFYCVRPADTERHELSFVSPIKWKIRFKCIQTKNVTPILHTKHDDSSIIIFLFLRRHLFRLSFLLQNNWTTLFSLLSCID